MAPGRLQTCRFFEGARGKPSLGTTVIKAGQAAIRYAILWIKGGSVKGEARGGEVEKLTNI